MSRREGMESGAEKSIQMRRTINRIHRVDLSLRINVKYGRKVALPTEHEMQVIDSRLTGES